MGEPGEASAGGAVGGGDPRLESIDPELVARMTEDEIKKFIDTGRTGRRNALPDVNQPDNVTTSTAGMAEALESLSVGPSNPEDKKEEASTSGASSGGS